MEDGDTFPWKFVGSDGHPRVSFRAHLVSSSLDLVCPYVGQCWDTLGPTQGPLVPSSASDSDPRCPKSFQPVEVAVQWRKLMALHCV